MTADVIKALEKEEPSEFHANLLKECLADIKRSRAEMSKSYSTWDMQNEVYKGLRPADQDDLKQRRQGKPEKMIVPNTYAQVMSMTSFLFLMFKQGDKFFELKPTGSEDYGKKWEDCENVLQRDWARSQGSHLLFQNLLDMTRFGTAPMEVSWTREEVSVWVDSSPFEQNLNGQSLQSSQAAGYQTFLKFEGNRVRNVSPYRWFPDVTFPVSDFYRGDYCASEEDFTIAGLKELEKQEQPQVAGISHIKPFATDWQRIRGAATVTALDINPGTWGCSGSSPVIVTKMRKKIIPKDFELDKGKYLGDEERPILYTIWIANDNRIIRLEPCAEWHQQLGFAVSQFTPDMHETVSFGLTELIYRLQDVISWFVNSHISSVRRVIQNRMVINTSLVEPKSYDGEGDIFVRKGVGRVDLRMVVSQLPASDVTAGHMTDVELLGKLMQTVTGVNENAMGQYNGGRRSASEARVVTAGAAGRMKMHGHLIWESCFSRLGQMMLSNSRQSLSSEAFAQALGGLSDPIALAERYKDFQGTPKEIICADDYLVFDSTLASEKGYMAQNLQELLSLILQSNPAAAMQLSQRIDPVKLVDEMQYLRDGTPVSRMMYDPGTQPAPMPQMLPSAQAQ